MFVEVVVDFLIVCYWERFCCVWNLDMDWVFLCVYVCFEGFYDGY